MKFDFGAMSCASVPALSALLSWVQRQPDSLNSEQMTVFVDSYGDFCAVEYVSRPYEHTSRSHRLIDCITSIYVPVVVPLGVFRRRVEALAVNAGIPL